MSLDDKIEVIDDEKQVTQSHDSTSEETVHTTTKVELWAYYLYYVGNNGLSAFDLGPSAFQNLLFLAGYDPTQNPFTAPCSSAGCVLPFMGKVRDVNSVVLLTNGISLAVQAVLLLAVGAWADYGRWRPNITILFTLLAIGVSFAWLGVNEPVHWRGGVPLYILGLVAYQGAQTFWSAAFPGLARDLPEVRESLADMKARKKTANEHAELDSLARNRISNMSFTVCSAGEVIILAVMVGILKALKSDQSTEANTKAFSILIAYTGGIWFLCALPWFLLEKRRPGLDLPPNTSLVTIGFKQVYVAFRESLKLKQTFLYLIFYFLMSAVLNTSVTVIGTLQNTVVSYSTLQLTLLLIVGIVTQGLGIYVFWLVQKRFSLTTKTMLTFNAFCIVVLTLWGLVGVRTSKFGYKHIWEIWLYQAYYGFMVCPWYAYSLTMISDVSPLPQIFLFFALFSVVGKVASFVGSLVSSAIISASNDNDNMPFSLLFGVGILSIAILWMVDVTKSRTECEEFIKAEGKRDAFKVNN